MRYELHARTIADVAHALGMIPVDHEAVVYLPRQMLAAQSLTDFVEGYVSAEVVR